MSLPAKLHTTFLPSELFFLSEDTLISITSHISLSSIQLIGITTPRLRSGRTAEVPLWLAVILKQQVKCAIMLPRWMSLHSLKEIYDEEIKNVNAFCEKLPKDWLEISQTLLDVARDDLRSPPHIIRNLLRDIREARQAKARSGIRELNESHMRLDNLGTLELNELRPFVTLVMDELRRMVSTLEVDAEDEDGYDSDDDYDYEYPNYNNQANTQEDYQRDQDQNQNQNNVDNIDLDLDLSLPEDTTARITDFKTSEDNYDEFDESGYTYEYLREKEEREIQAQQRQAVAGSNMDLDPDQHHQDDETQQIDGGTHGPGATNRQPAVEDHEMDDY